MYASTCNQQPQHTVMYFFSVFSIKTKYLHLVQHSVLNYYVNGQQIEINFFASSLKPSTSMMEYGLFTVYTHIQTQKHS